MAAFVNLQDRFFGHRRANIAVFDGKFRKSCQAIEFGHDRCIPLQLPSRLMHRLSQLQKQFVLELFARLIGSENLLLVLLELGRDVTLTVLKCLLANVIRRDSIPMRIGDLDVISKDRCETNFQTRDPGRLRLFGLIARDPLFTTRS